MPPKSKTPPGKGRVSRDSFADLSLELPTLEAVRVQFLIARHINPDLAVILAAVAFDGCAHG